MQQASIPAKFPVPFAATGAKNTIPSTSQIGILNGAASLPDGFPPLTFLPVAAGGVPPFGADMNGILFELSSWAQWESAGGPVVYDAAFSTAIGGYPKGAWLTSSTGGSWWMSTVDNNTTNPDTGGAGWQLLTFGQTYAGNPNGNVAGNAGTTVGITQSFLWDSAHGLLWVCTTTGTAGTAVWSPLTTLSPVNPSVTGANYAFGLSDLGQLRVRSNSGVAMADTLPTGMANGWWTEIINGDATASDTISAPSGKNLNGVLNGTIILSAGQNTSITCDALGNFWITAMPAPKLTAAQATYINASSSLNPGVYEIDTSAGPVTITLEVTPTLGDNYEFKDAYGTFAANNLILNPNGKTIQGSASNFNIDVNGLDFALEYKSGNWSLQ